MKEQGLMTTFLKKISMTEVLVKLIAMGGFSVHSIVKSSFIRELFSRQDFSLAKNNKTIMKFVIESYNEKRQEFDEYFQTEKRK